MAGPMSLPQFLISLPLFFCLAFGLGFIINMLLKTTWIPGYLYSIVLILSAIWIFYKNQQFLHWIDIVVLTSGLAGAFLSGWTIQLLRKKGYRMF